MLVNVRWPVNNGHGGSLSQWERVGVREIPSEALPYAARSRT